MRKKELIEIDLYNQRKQRLYAAKTGIQVDIQNIGRNKSAIACKVDRSLKEVHPGVWLSTELLEFPDGNFSNIYDLFWNYNNPNLTAVVHSEKKPYYLMDYMEKDPSIISIINGSFFFLIDVVDREPKDYPFHFCVRKGKVVGLPSSDEPIIYTVKEQFYAKEPQAKGTIEIARTTFEWFGAQSRSITGKKDVVSLYNAGSCILIKTYDPKTGVRMAELDHDHIHTPKNPDAVDLVINKNKRGDLVITHINNGGGTHYFDGLLTLHMPAKKNTFKIGDKVTPLTLDDLDLKTVSSGISIGRSINDPFYFEPHRINSRDARSVIAQDVTGNIHFIIFDGSKYIPNFRGISAKDVVPYFSKDRYKWAYFLDGGSSSRIILREGNNLTCLANDFAFKKVTNEIFLWDSNRHRKLASSIAIKMKKTSST